MTTANHLRLIDGLCTREFPSERVVQGSGVSGPGFHTVYLHGEEVQRGQEDGDAEQQPDADEAEWVERRASCLAAYDALSTLLTLRWGAPDVVSLWSARERMTAGEEIAEPWADPVASCEYLLLWRVGERWIALVLHGQEQGLGCELSALVTQVDPP
ncbi:hypothetical protein ABZ371_08855 [Streptomyces sp. NPDC005899]|uniref:hypothetical protein n=1 Tax=Streptomyces sp. NPDC005899 TaxID=3155716 RepID=UPI0033D35BA5